MRKTLHPYLVIFWKNTDNEIEIENNKPRTQAMPSKPFAKAFDIIFDDVLPVELSTAIRRRM